MILIIMKKEKKVYVVPHSHWDREWYFTIEDSNILLVENIDYLIEVLENDLEFKSYVFDGQVSVIDEYLRIRPEQKDRLKKLIKNKRLLIGPWYTQTDSLLVNIESVIRNLLYGTKLADELGCCMKVGYLPDLFGQNAYLPSIFEGFDIKYSILQRGVYTDWLSNNLNFFWESPDKKKVMANNLYFGYGPGKFLNSDEGFYKTTLLPILKELEKLNNASNNLLLPSGGDQVLVRKDFPKIVKRLNEKNSNYEFIMSDYQTFMEETWKETNFFNNIKGELIASENSRIHRTISSQRYDLKKLNSEVENLLLHLLEPLAVIGKSVGLKYPKNFLDMMWKSIFDVHSHDSIGGCNSDETNNDILMRLNKIKRTAEGLINIIQKQMSKAVSHYIDKENIMLIFNLLPTSQTRSLKTTIFTKTPSFDLCDLSKKKLTYSITKQVYIDGGKKIIVSAEGEKEIKVEGYYRSELIMFIENIPPMGYMTIIIDEINKNKTKFKCKINNIIANEFLKIKFENSKIILIHKKSGIQIDNFISFENLGDAGDSYDFSPLEGDEPLVIKKAELLDIEEFELVKKMNVLHTIKLPANLEERSKKIRTKDFAINTTFELRKNENFLRITHQIKNNVRDHRTRVLIKSNLYDIKHSFVDQGFSIIKRPVVNPHLKDWKAKGFSEAPVPIYSLENFVSVYDKNHNINIITKGIKEYEIVLDNHEIAITLFRAVGVLGKDDLAWRPGRASGINDIQVLTPDAQLEKEMKFEYAIYLSNQIFKSQDIFDITDKYNEHVISYQLQKLYNYQKRLERFEIPYPIEELGDSFSLFSIDNDNIFVKACKLAYEGDGIILRLFNPTDDIQKFSLNFKNKIIITNLYEKELEVIKNAITISPKNYITLKIKN